ncbi:hypothetical protein SETIT_2G206600v2 [Setaria italica]|uniref:Uncharacterized protein n=1 Tax=Setaria italica TaxID=4555 RepID=A0A368Q0X6_SETIT|nr:hypothetical protein SETIT_2G206600v2 [Setaria italica]
MGWGGALDMAVVWLTEESEHAAARLHLCETQLLLRAHFSVCQLSLLLGTCSAASNSPSHSHPSLRTVASSCSCCRVLSSIAVAVAAPFVLRLPAGRPAWPCPHLKTLSCLLLVLRWPALWNKVLLNFRQPLRACTPWILAPGTSVFAGRFSLPSLGLPMMDY